MSPNARLIVASALAMASAAANANIVKNPGFEQGGTGWKGEHFMFLQDPLWAHTGPGAAVLSYCNRSNCLNTINSGAFVSQLLSTEPGAMYNLTFWVRSFSGESRLSVFWDGVQLTNTGTPNGPMLQYAFSGLAASAAATQLQVHGFNSLHQHMAFDDFSVVKAGLATPPPPVTPQQQPVSEPAMYGLILAALGVMVATMRRPFA